MKIKILILIALFFCSGASYLSTQEKAKEERKELAPIPDVFSDLDDAPVNKSSIDDKLLKVFELAKTNYQMALSFIENRDTSSSYGYFEESLKTLNTLSDLPEATKNSEFTNLLSRIIADYLAVIPDNPKFIKSSLISSMSEKYLDKQIVINQSKVKVESITINKSDSLQSTGQFKNENIIPLEDNEFVQKSIEFLTQNKIGKKFIKNCIERYSKWGPMLSEIISEEGMPQEIIFLSMVESALNPMAVSRAKAVGMWQFMRPTGLDYGLNGKGSVWLEERKDPVKATKAAMRHLKDLYNTFNDWYLAMAAYNYGTSGVKKSINRSKLDNPTFWELRDFLPKETKNYVPLFIATAKVAMNPKDYGIDIAEFNLLEEFKFDLFTIDEPISLKALAKCAGLSLDEFKEYNPELILSCTPPDLTQYSIRIPEGSKTSFIASLATLAPEEKQPWVTHITGKKETFESIARVYGVTAGELASVNNMTLSKKHLKKGLTLRVPTESIIPADEIALRLAKSKSNNNDEDEQDSENADYVTHTVGKGESLPMIANQYNVSLGDLKKINDIYEDNPTLDAGTVLKITPKSVAVKKQTSQKPNRPDVIKHTVKDNETIDSIAKHYSITSDEIRQWNNIRRDIRTGQNLKIITSAPYTPYITRKVPERKLLRPVDSTIAKNNQENIQPKISREDNNSDDRTNDVRKTHKVKRGENLASIADKYNISINNLKEWNPKTIKGSKVNAGTVLKLYTNENKSVNKSKETKKLSKKEKSTKNKKAKSQKSYTIQKNDNLQTISEKTGVPVSTIKKLNKNINSQTLKIGQKIKLKK
jgi:membrane-bound lytic murein transglycosylase D